MLVYLATYPRCGHSVLRHLLKLNFGLPTDLLWDERPGDRGSLAAAPDMYLAKTHAPPHKAYLPGERAIQLIRHPGAAIASHYQLQRHMKPDATRPLKRFIAGQKQTGDWSSYHRAWASAPLPFLRLRYEDVTADPAPGVVQIGAFLGLPPPATIVSDPAEDARARNPGRNPIAGPDAWRDLFDAKDTARLWERHGALAAENGYC